MFEDEPNILPPGVKDDCIKLAYLEDDLIVCFLQPVSIKEDGPGDKSRVGQKGDNREMMTVLAAVLTKKKKRCNG
ncbi:hypothetical protein DVH24_000087 [Malus domestica]|uniref:Uncharacterized protein n=1 Tax=Malus domestica TaxID=3750 RepID=A0A498IYX7_MALDO|nr:hypothetical protein DVH24_000087 [Malus domestica]